MKKEKRVVKQDKFRIYIGYSPREDEAFRVAAYSIWRSATVPIEIIKLDQGRLRKAGIYKRTELPGQQATEFAYTRFLVPYLDGFKKHWSLFIDCDMVCTVDIKHLIDIALSDDSYAVRCVKHPQYVPKHSIKMDNQAQTSYPRKNWSSVILFNSGHEYNKVLMPDKINTETGAYLHRFSWLSDRFIGSLPKEWNWLTQEDWPTPDRLPFIIHQTNCSTCMRDRPDYLKCEYHDLYMEYLQEYEKHELDNKIYSELSNEGATQKPKLSIKELSDVAKVKQNVCIPCGQKKKK